jgi:hypothetical protein
MRRACEVNQPFPGYNFLHIADANVDEIDSTT